MSNLLLASYFKNTTATNIRNTLLNITKEGEICEWECKERSKPGEIIPITGFNGFRLKFRTTNKSKQLVVSNPDLYIRSGGMYGLGFRNLHCVGNCVTKDNVSSKIEFHINNGGELEYTPKKTNLGELEYTPNNTNENCKPCVNGGCIMTNDNIKGGTKELCCYDGSGGTGCNTSDNLCGIDASATLCGRNIDKCHGTPPVAGSAKGIFLILYIIGPPDGYWGTNSAQCHGPSPTTIPWNGMCPTCQNEVACKNFTCLSNGIDDWFDDASYQIIIMFAGASILEEGSDGNFYYNTQLISQLPVKLQPATNRDVYFSIGGGKNAWGPADISAYTDAWIKNNVINNNYSGVCFDIENTGTMSVEDFINVFKMTKKHKLKVMVTISYFGAGEQLNPAEQYAELATSCLQGVASPYVDVFSPQLYADDCDDGGAWPVGGGRDWDNLEEEQQQAYVNIKSNVKLMPAINTSNSDDIYDNKWETLRLKKGGKPDKPSGYIQYCNDIVQSDFGC